MLITPLAKITKLLSLATVLAYLFLIAIIPPLALLFILLSIFSPCIS